MLVGCEDVFCGIFMSKDMKISLSWWLTMVSPTQLCCRFHSLPLNQHYSTRKKIKPTYSYTNISLYPMDWCMLNDDTSDWLLLTILCSTILDINLTKIIQDKMIYSWKMRDTHTYGSQRSSWGCCCKLKCYEIWFEIHTLKQHVWYWCDVMLLVCPVWYNL